MKQTKKREMLFVPVPSSALTESFIASLMLYNSHCTLMSLLESIAHDVGYFCNCNNIKHFIETSCICNFISKLGLYYKVYSLIENAI